MSPAKSVAAQARVTGIAAEICQQANAGARFSVEAIGAADIATLQDIADTYREEGIVTRPVRAVDGLLPGYFQPAKSTSHE
ncbi:hypothetical protein [Azomonas macrocytogenes]|uniref:Uncharacterized protein n=1 Tax=Azomonas macrocytogenes TaxID=69962 RepID=A0A839SZY1_AZOMA|nr:hypothetical protein [Azomonas macrocytogenes]MBB3102712.1 hypothetical protein [Azomonas macrocytogenes]